MNSQKILLITGGTGYIGSHAVVAFEQAGYKTVILDNLVNSSRDTLFGIEKILGYCPDFFECDIRDRKWLEEIFQKYEFDGVIHFAGLKAFGESTTYPYMYLDNNVTGTLTLLDVMDRYGVHQIVFSSSASVYDGSNTPPFTEDMKLGTTNPYATSKLTIEFLLQDYAKQKGFRSAILRYFNLIGAHNSWYLGDYPRSNHGSLSSNIFDVIFGKKGKLFIYGDDFPTPDGTAIRDYIDVCDLVDGHIRAFEWAASQIGGKWDVWNLGTGKWLSVKELISVTEKITEKEVPVEVIPRRSIDLAIPISNPEKAERELQWSAKRTIEESIENTWKFLSRVRKQENSHKKPRVMHFLPYFPPHSGGVEMYAKEWVENYVLHWGEWCIVTFSVWQKLPSRKENGYEVIVLPAFDVVHSFPFPMFWMPSFWSGIFRAKNWKPEVIHTHTRFFLSSFLGGILAKFWKKPWIHIEHGSGFVVSGSNIISQVSRWYDATLGKWTLIHTDEVVAVSEACEHFVRDVFGVKKVRTIYRGITPTLSEIMPSKEEVHIGYIGRLVDLKWIDILLRAFAQFQKEYTGKEVVKLKIIGDGPERKKLEKLTETLTLSPSVEFLGQQSIDRVRKEFLPSFHVFVNPSFQEWLPTTVIEALIAGNRVIATDVGGTREILRYTQFTLIAPGSVRALSEALLNEVSSLGNQPKQKLPISLFLWEQTFREFGEVYKIYQ